MIWPAGCETMAATRSFELRSSSIKRIPIIGPLAPEIAVDKHIHATESVLGLIDQRLDLGLAGHIGQFAVH